MKLSYSSCSQILYKTFHVGADLEYFAVANKFEWLINQQYQILYTGESRWCCLDRRFV